MSPAAGKFCNQKEASGRGDKKVSSGKMRVRWMRNVYKKWEINSAKMNKAICAEWDGKLRVLSRDSTTRTGTSERLFVFSDMQDKNRDNPGQMDKKIPVSFDTGIFFGLFSRFMLIGYTEIAHPESAASRASSARRLSSSDSARSSRPEP